MGGDSGPDYELCISSLWELENFPTNNVKHFKNRINDKLKVEGAIGVFVKLEKIIICGAKENQFLLCCDGIPPSNTHGFSDCVMGVCVNPCKERIMNGDDGNSIRTYRFNGDEGGYFPLALGHVENWNITLVPWGCN